MTAPVAASPSAVPARSATDDSPAPPSEPSDEPASTKKRQDAELFVDWPTPTLAIVATGDQLGYIEPCGCAGLENQKGGLARRYTFLEDLRKKGWPVLAVDVGGQVNRYGPQAEIKYQTAADGLKQMQYAGVGFAPEDLRLPAGVLAASVVESDGSPSRFVDSNVGLFAADSGLTSRYRIVEVGGKKVGITAVLADAMQRDVNNAEIAMSAAEASLAEVVPKLKAESDYRILLSYATPEETSRLATKYPDFQLAVTAQGAAEPPARAETIPNTPTTLVEVGHKGMFAVVIGLFDDAKTPVRYQRVPLDSRFADAAAMLALKRTYQSQLETMVKAQGWEALGAKAQSYPNAVGDGSLAGKFVGSEACGECHTKAMAVWRDTPHAHATQSIVEIDPPRHFDPECVSCHATGWNAQGFYPYLSGYVGLDETPKLVGNGCENCHGPGAAHTEAERTKDVAKLDALRKSVHLTLAIAKDRVCMTCHDIDNSPEFNFDDYWPQVEHHGKD
jgi:hypothetical protein